MPTMLPTEDDVKEIVKLTRAGVRMGLGSPSPGQMCLEAIVSNVIDKNHSSSPMCVGEDVSRLVIVLNDSPWSSCKARGLGLQKVGIAQLGSSSFSEKTLRDFMDYTCLYFFQTVIPALVKNANDTINAFGFPATSRANALLAKTQSQLNEIANLVKQTEKGDSLTDSYVQFLIREDIARTANAIESGLEPVQLVVNVIQHLKLYCYASPENPGDRIGHLALAISKTVRYVDGLDSNDVIMNSYAEALLKALNKVKSPGCQWLYLADTSVAA